MKILGHNSLDVTMSSRSVYLARISGVQTNAFEKAQKPFCYIFCTGATERGMSIRLPRDEAEKLYAMLGKELNGNREQTARTNKRGR
jgi:hypothetical protein